MNTKVKKIASLYLVLLYMRKDKLLSVLIKRIRRFFSGNFDKMTVLNFMAVVPQFLTFNQNQKLAPYFSSLDKIYSSEYYKQNFKNLNDKVEQLKEQNKQLKDDLQNPVGPISKLTLVLGNFNNLNFTNMELTTLVGNGIGAKISIKNEKLSITGFGQGYSVNDVISLKQFCLVFIVSNISSSVFIEAKLDDVNATIPYYVSVFIKYSEKTNVRDIDLLPIIKYEEEKYGTDYINKKYL